MTKLLEKKKAEKILKSPETKEILSYWDDPNTQVRSCELRRKFVKGFQKFVLRTDLKYYDGENKKIVKKKPRMLFENDASFYRHLADMVACGILHKKPIPQTKGKPATYYRPSKKYRKEGLRIQNKTALDYYPPDSILNLQDISSRHTSQVEHSTTQQITYGLSRKMYNKLKEKDKQAIKKYLKNMENNICEIEKIKTRIFFNELEKKKKEFFKETKSQKIKEFIKENFIRYWACVQDSLFANSEDILHSKKAFYKSLGWIFKPHGETDTKSPKCIILISQTGDELYDFIKGEPRVLTKLEAKKYCKAWSKNFCCEDYGFSLNDIEEMIEFGWKIKGLFYEYYPLPIAFSRYKDYEDNLLISYVPNKILESI